MVSCITFFEKKRQLDLPAQWKVGSGVAFKVQTLCFASTGVHKYALTACVDGVGCRKARKQSERGSSEKYSAIFRTLIEFRKKMTQINFHCKFCHTQ